MKDARQFKENIKTLLAPAETKESVLFTLNDPEIERMNRLKDNLKAKITIEAVRDSYIKYQQI